MKTIIWVDKGNKNYFKMGEKPITDADTSNFDCFEVEKLSYMEYEELKSQGHIVIYVDGKFKIKIEDFDREKRIEEIRKELYDLRIEKEKQPFEFEVKGVKYLQNNRSIDQSNLTRIVVMCQATKKTTFDNWKFYTKDNSEKYVSISITDMMRMAEIMQEQTTKSMATETLLSHNLENLTEEELKNYNVKERYEKFWNEAMKEE